MLVVSLPPALAAIVASFVAFHPVFVDAQYPPPASYKNILTSPINPNVTIAYKQPDAGTCQTAFITQKQYTGYIGIPPYTLTPIQQNYSINTFFWFIEARQTPEVAPLTIWLNGGPGSSSMLGLFNEVGPCEVVQMNDGSYGTQARMYGWDRSSNILFVDQPNQVGFSYDSATNASYDLFTNNVFEPPTAHSTDLPHFMYMNGTFGTANTNDQVPFATTANTTEIAAQATWHFLQSWLSAFPQYNPAVRSNVTVSGVNSAAAGIHLFAESYGGKYGPAFASFFDEQNSRRANGSLPSNTTVPLKLESLGILNGQIDDAVQNYWYPMFAYNNTYGIEAISQVEELNDLNLYNTQCLTQINACRDAMNSTDAVGDGDVSATNELCYTAQLTCNNLTASYASAGYDPYDIRQKLPSPDPPAAYQEYLNNETVLAAIGARVNYTESSRYVQAGFVSTGDTIRGGQMDDIAYLLTQGIRVALIYGDADYICNWYGGEAVSLAVADLLPDYPPPTTVFANNGPPHSGPPSYASGFPAAGYAEIVTNESYVGGEVRQYGNLSFSRIFDAGHFVPYFQPNTAFEIFSRIIQGKDIGTGQVIDLTSYSSSGPANSTHTNSAPAAPSQTCWIRSWNSTCSAQDNTALLAGRGLVANGIFYLDNASVSVPSTSVDAGFPGRPMSSNSNAAMLSGTGKPSPLTGVYTATNTPSPSSGAASAKSTLPRIKIKFSPVLAILLSFALGMLVGF